MERKQRVYFNKTCEMKLTTDIQKKRRVKPTEVGNEGRLMEEDKTKCTELQGKIASIKVMSNQTDRY